MFKYYHRLLFMVILLVLNSCAKDESVNVLQDQYELSVKDAETAGEDFIVNLHASALQKGESGEWTIVSGVLVDKFVSFEDKHNPFTSFKGIPGEEYTLEWKRRVKDGTTSAVQIKVNIPKPAFEIEDHTPSEFETIRLLSVNPKYRGTWSFEGAYARLNSKYHDGYAEPAEKKPSVELHGYANTTYTATFKYTYAGRIYETQKVITTGNYTQDEGLYELQLSRGSTRVVADHRGNILELDMQASGITWIFGEPDKYPALQSFKKLRKLILGGSSLEKISTLFGDHYLDLEELNMDRMGFSTVFPDNFGNMTKLKVLVFAPRFTMPADNEVILPKSFANLKALEIFSVKSSGFVDFNGTLGYLTSLKDLRTNVLSLTEDIGNLKALEHIELHCRNSTFPKRFSECKSLKFVRLIFNATAAGEVVLSPKIGDLKNLETLEITTSRLLGLPDSFSELTSLKTLKIEGNSVQTIPENFGNLANLESLQLYGAFTRLPDGFGNLSKLASLFLTGKTETLPESFGNLTSLTYFNAEYSNLKTLPNSIGKLKKLKEMHLQFSKVESLPVSFAELDALEVLYLNNTPLKTFPTAIIPLKSIIRVTLNNTNVGDIPDDIAKMKTGVVFNLINIPNLTLDHLNYIMTIAKGKVFNTSFGYFSTY